MLGAVGVYHCHSDGPCVCVCVCAGLPGGPGPRAAVPAAAAGPGGAAEEPGRRLLRGRPPIGPPLAGPPAGGAGARPAEAPGHPAGEARRGGAEERVPLGPGWFCDGCQGSDGCRVGYLDPTTGGH